jgi:Uncharacterized protein involved in propionate catabolism
MPYCIARTFLDGEMTLDQFAPEKIRGEDVRELMDKMEIVENERYTEVYGEAFPHKMTVHTEDDVYERELECPKGHPGNPLTEEELENKFRECAEEALGDESAGEALDWMLSVEEKEDASELFEYV